jgi:hypothetical protein
VGRTCIVPKRSSQFDVDSQIRARTRRIRNLLSGLQFVGSR